MSDLKHGNTILTKVIQMDKRELIEKINKLKKEKNAIVLAHTYQNLEIDEVADFSGDSLYLSRQAANTDADIIVFAGVYFMAETAKILSPDKTVLLPNLSAGCAMADKINVQQLREFKAKHPDVPVVCYVNSTAEVKAESDVCCTSANAINVVKSLNAKEVLFVPDQHLGAYAESQLDGVKVITYPGYCPVHHAISPVDITEKKKLYPCAKVMVHPECPAEVSKMADFVGSTTAIIKAVKESDAKEFIIVTEKGVVERLERDCPDKKFVLINEKAVCDTMKLLHLQDILNALENNCYEINVDAQIAKKALKSIDRMISINA